MAQALYPVVGVDIGKDTMHIVALDRSGAIAHKQRCTRATVLTRLLQLDTDLIAMEACPGAHHLGRCLSEQGRTVHLLVAADVRAFVRGHKNDYNDAQAIAEGQTVTRHYPATDYPRVAEIDDYGQPGKADAGSYVATLRDQLFSATLQANKVDN